MFDLDQYVENSFPEARRSGDERIVHCFLCGGKWKLYINVEKRRYFCYKCEAGRGANLVTLIRDHRGVTEHGAWEILRSNRYQGYETRSYGDIYEARQSVPLPATVLPPEYTPFYPREDLAESVLGSRGLAYLRRRGLTEADFMLYRIGYCASGRYRNRIIVPVVRDGEVVYFLARRFFGYGGPRYLNPRNEEIREHPSNLLFNWDGAKSSATLQITEGVFDAIGLGEDATSVFGKQIHPGQLRLLGSGRFEKVELWLDSEAKDPEIRRDEEGLAFALRELGKPVTIYSLAYGDPAETRLGPIPSNRREGGSWTSFFDAKGSRR